MCLCAVVPGRKLRYTFLHTPGVLDTLQYSRASPGPQRSLTSRVYFILRKLRPREKSTVRPVCLCNYPSDHGGGLSPRLQVSILASLLPGREAAGGGDDGRADSCSAHQPHGLMATWAAGQSAFSGTGFQMPRVTQGWPRPCTPLCLPARPSGTPYPSCSGPSHLPL